jgi:hypothetical protein
MTARVQTLHVTLDKEYRTDDVQAIVRAIEMVKGVAKVNLGEPMDIQDYMARQTVFHEFNMMMYELLSAARENTETFQQVKALLAKDWKKRTGQSMF